MWRRLSLKWPIKHWRMKWGSKSTRMSSFPTATCLQCRNLPLQSFLWLTMKRFTSLSSGNLLEFQSTDWRANFYLIRFSHNLADWIPFSEPIWWLPMVTSWITPWPASTTTLLWRTMWAVKPANVHCRAFYRWLRPKRMADAAPGSSQARRMPLYSPRSSWISSSSINQPPMPSAPPESTPNRRVLPSNWKVNSISADQ